MFPATIKILGPEMVFNRKAPIIMGVEVTAGQLRVGTPICIPSRDFLELGRCAQQRRRVLIHGRTLTSCDHLADRIGTIELDKKPVDTAKKGQQVAVRITPMSFAQNSLTFGRQFDDKDELVSKVSRESIDLLKEFHKEDLTKEDWKLVVKLKRVLGVI